MAGLTIVLDYSGTLSLEAVAFARDDFLVSQLHISGLAGFGVDSPEIFWDSVVNPTWEEGSRTAIGYRRLLAGKISEKWTAGRREDSLAALDRAAGIFAARYFSHSRIEPSWRPLLGDLYNHPLIKVVVATDHYAEATETIKGQLQDMEMRAVSLPTGAAGTGSRFFIANSADLGYHKDEEEFWLPVRELTNWRPEDRLLLVDDFGANEVAGDRYGQEARVTVRRQRTTELLTKVFVAPVEVVPFILSGGETGRDEEAQLLIGQIAIKIRECLRKGVLPHV